MKKISIIASFINEEKNLPLFIDSIQDTFNQIQGWDYEIIFVDDCSIDKSLEVLLNFSKLNSRIKIIKMSKRYGHSNSIQAAFENITDGNFSMIIDCDMQDDPKIIIENLMNIKEDETIHFVRSKREDGIFQKIYSYIAYKILRLISFGKIIESAGYFKIIPPNTTKMIKNDNEYLPYWNYLITKYSKINKQIEYIRKERKFGNSKFGILTLNPWLTYFGGAHYFKKNFILLNLLIIFFLSKSILLLDNIILKYFIVFLIFLVCLKLSAFIFYCFVKFFNSKPKCHYELINF